MKEHEEKINELASSLQDFLLYFDSLFLVEESNEKLLEEAMKSLKEKVNRNESELPLIIAMGGNYESSLDKAKIKVVKALIDLLKARKEVRSAIDECIRRKINNEELLKIFGI